MTLASRSLSWALLIICLPLALALKFDIQAHPAPESSKHERCIRNVVARDTLVVVTATIGGQKGDGQMLNMHVRAYLPVDSCAAYQ